MKIQNSVSRFDAVAYGYTPDDENKIKLNVFHMPLVPVKINDYNTWLVLDFGSSGCITLTTHIKDKIEFSINGEQNSYWSDGRIRGKIQNITVDSISFHDIRLSNHQCVLADWKMYSSLPLNGLIGLQYFIDQRITIDYKNRKLYLSNSCIPAAIKESSNSLILPLIMPPKHFMSGVFVQGKINGNNTIVYIDSGNSKTSINKKYFRSKPKSINLELGNQIFKISNFKEENNIEFQDFRKDIGIVLGSDFLKDSVITIDRTQGNNQMILIKY